jgi:hypothetical protein
VLNIFQNAEWPGAKAGNIRQLFVNDCFRKMQVAGGRHGEAAESAAMAQPASHEIQIV